MFCLICLSVLFFNSFHSTNIFHHWLSVTFQLWPLAPFPTRAPSGVLVCHDSDVPPCRCAECVPVLLACLWSCCSTGRISAKKKKKNSSRPFLTIYWTCGFSYIQNYKIICIERFYNTPWPWFIKDIHNFLPLISIFWGTKQCHLCHI